MSCERNFDPALQHAVHKEKVPDVGDFAPDFE
jgi:hypothetical protein